MDENLVVVGRVAGHYGVRGWVKIVSYTEPHKNILGYRPWYLELAGNLKLLESTGGREHGKGLIAQFAGIEDRAAAAGLIDANIFVNRKLFAKTRTNEYYWGDLTGLQVATINGVALGIVDSLLETGANDVLVVEGDRRRLIPFIADAVIKVVDLDAGTVTVDWDPEF